MMLQVKKYMKFLLAALLVFGASNAFPFVNGGRLGTIAEPFIPSLVVVK